MRKPESVGGKQKLPLLRISLDLKQELVCLPLASVLIIYAYNDPDFGVLLFVTVTSLVVAHKVSF